MEFSFPQLNWMCEEVERQKARPTAVYGMAKAVAYAIKKDVLDFYDLHEMNAMIVDEPFMMGFRTSPVTFQNGGSSSRPADILSDMERLWEFGYIPVASGQVSEQDEVAMPDGLWMDLKELDTKNAVKHFLQIHPYLDGNGRTAAILFNHMLGTLEAPRSLPNFFGEEE